MRINPFQTQKKKDKNELKGSQREYKFQEETISN